MLNSWIPAHIIIILFRICSWDLQQFEVTVNHICVCKYISLKRLHADAAWRKASQDAKVMTIVCLGVYFLCHAYVVFIILHVPFSSLCSPCTHLTLTPSLFSSLSFTHPLRRQTTLITPHNTFKLYNSSTLCSLLFSLYFTSDPILLSCFLLLSWADPGLHQ